MAFSEIVKTRIRFHLGYGPLGNLPNGASFSGYRFFVEQGLLEFRMLNLSATEESVIVGTGSQVSPIFPNFTDPDDDKVYDGYLPICDVLEGKVALASGDLDTSRAGEWYARPDEIEARVRLYNYWCRKLAQALYLPIGGGDPRHRTAPPRGFMVN